MLEKVDKLQLVNIFVYNGLNHFLKLNHDEIFTVNDFFIDNNNDDIFNLADNFCI